MNAEIILKVKICQFSQEKTPVHGKLQVKIYSSDTLSIDRLSVE